LICKLAVAINLKFYFFSYLSNFLSYLRDHASTPMFKWSGIKMKSLKLPNNEYFSIYMQIGENNGKLIVFHA